jgi:hypothetical protein
MDPSLNSRPVRVSKAQKIKWAGHVVHRGGCEMRTHF